MLIKPLKSLTLKKILENTRDFVYMDYMLQYLVY